METINQLFIYIFEATPGRGFQYYIPLIILTVVFFSLALFIFLRKRKIKDKAFKKAFRSYIGSLSLLGVLLSLYIFSRYITLPFFSSRIVLYILIAVSVYYFYKLGNTFFIEYPAQKNKYEKQEEKDKYKVAKKKRKNK